MELKNVSKVETNKTELEIRVDGETFNKAINKVYKKQVKSINIPGFRKGKAPRKVIEKMYGKEVFYEDAMREVYPKAVQEAADEAKLRTVPDKVDLDVVEVSEDGFTFKVQLTTYPEIEIKDYKGIEIEAISDEVTDEKIDEQIDRVRRRAGRTEIITDRPVEKDDTAVIDFEGFVDGEAFDGGKAENYSLVIGSGSFIPGFEDQIIGHNIDEEFSVNVTFPEDYQEKSLAGKPAEFKVTVHEIKARILPELNDEFVQDVSGESETVEQYREEVRKELAEELKTNRENDIANKVAEALAEKVEGEIPHAMVDNRVTDMVREFDMRLRQQGLNLESYIKYTGMSEEILRDQYEQDAAKQVNVRLALEKIAQLENIVPTEEDIEAEYKKLADMYKMDVEKVKRIVIEDDIKKDVAASKAMDLVKENAVIK
ncbi:MAG: trigger factor [Clostridia bacterium]|nr:trigger factor [Clostridia bacterium]